jgi:hypothetical protein
VRLLGHLPASRNRRSSLCAGIRREACRPADTVRAKLTADRRLQLVYDPAEVYADHHLDGVGLEVPAEQQQPALSAASLLNWLLTVWLAKMVPLAPSRARSSGVSRLSVNQLRAVCLVSRLLPRIGASPAPRGPL